jgi:predicted dehydrogenase
VALADHKRELAERVAEFQGVRRVYTDHTAMLENEELDAVIICAHPRRQPEIAIDCLRAGVHVWVEKPPAESYEDAEHMALEAAVAGKHLAVGYMKRYSQPYLEAKRFMSVANFGPPSVFESRFTYGQYPVEAYSFLNGFATHHLDLARFFMGNVESVYAERVSRGSGLDGYAIVLRFSQDAVGVMNLNCLEGTHNNWSERVAITGVGSRVIVENWRRVIGFLPPTGDTDPPAFYWEPADIRPTDDEASVAVHGFVGELRDFVESVRQGRPPLCTIEDGVHALRLEHAVEHSLETGNAVAIADHGS